MKRFYYVKADKPIKPGAIYSTRCNLRALRELLLPHAFLPQHVTQHPPI